MVFHWGVSSFFGWGVYGLNLMLALAHHRDYSPMTTHRFTARDVVLDPLRNLTVAEYAGRSEVLWDTLDAFKGGDAALDAPLLIPCDADFLAGADPEAGNLTGSPTIGVAFLEQATLTPAARERAGRLAMIVAGSGWTAQVLRGHGLRSVTTVPQGVDTGQFHPAPRIGVPGRFVIFSGGKLEYRKGQDLVLAGFRAFRQRHAEALLVTAWHSPWNALSQTASGLATLGNPSLAPDGTPDVMGWAVANGIPAGSVIALGMTPNIAMPHVLREADVALFPNRCEGGTNLVAMECMACGVPTILSANTGHLDLLAQAGVAVPLRRQRQPVRPDVDTTGWGESEVEEIVEALEAVWRDRDAAAAMGQRAAGAMAGMNWPHQVNLLLRAIEAAAA